MCQLQQQMEEAALLSLPLSMTQPHMIILKVTQSITFH